ncbi:hypothetical protein GQ44DRAFT_709190 [Phaeosphaeriaceae sp. PMI808]|nr:hypothetical protein GQ44DRAFT_709190 [Phaeosphaeriaceae sp. PMI808]
MLPTDLNFDVSELDQELTSSHSGLSQRFDDYSLADERVVQDTHCASLSMPIRHHDIEFELIAAFSCKNSVFITIAK